MGYENSGSGGIVQIDNTEIKNKIGDLSTLTTINKTNLVESLNEHGASLADISTYDLKDSNGLKYKVVAGAIRKPPGVAWEFIVDSLHDADLNCISVSADTSAITINYAGLNAKKVVSFIIAPDESYSAWGYSCGASVAIDKAIVSVYRPTPYGVGGIIRCDGTQFTKDTSAQGVTSLSWNASNGTLSIGHTSMLSAGALISPPIFLPYDTGKFVPKIKTLWTSQTDVQFFDNAGNQIMTLSNALSFVFKRTSLYENRMALIDPSGATLEGNSANFWFIGVFEV